MINSVSVVTVTRNRSKDLMHCLGSLAMQSEVLDELIVVDNNSSDDTRKVVENFSQSVSFTVRYVLHTSVGYPEVYNRGLKEASGTFVAFIDDDCVADINWYRNIKRVVKKVPRVAAILGRSNEYYNKDVFALAKSYIDETGKIGAIKNNHIVDLEILDSKNIVYNLSFLNNHKIRFDTGLLKYAQGASEDCDIGMQIQKAGGIAVYNKGMFVVHKDPTSMAAYFGKAVFTLRNHLVYEKKWEEYRKSIIVDRTLLDRLQLFSRFVKRYELSVFKSIIVAAIVFLSFIYIKVLRKILKKEIELLKIAQI